MEAGPEPGQGHSVPQHLHRVTHKAFKDLWTNRNCGQKGQKLNSGDTKLCRETSHFFSPASLSPSADVLGNGMAPVECAPEKFVYYTLNP